jgi:hypothetical protein
VYIKAFISLDLLHHANLAFHIRILLLLDFVELCLLSMAMSIFLDPVNINWTIGLDN